MIRELAVYPDARTAAAVADEVRAGAAHCHRLPATAEEDALRVTVVGNGDGATHVAAAFAETLAGGQPGGAVFVFTRLGRAILAVEDGGEWAPASLVDGAREVQRADRGVVARMCLFSDAGC